MVHRLTNSTLRNRFSVGFNPETSRWNISFHNLSDDEFNIILGIRSQLGSNLTKWDLGGTLGEAQQAIRAERLTNTQARGFTHAVAARFRNQ
jgi:hypothetical protein